MKTFTVVYHRHGFAGRLLRLRVQAYGEQDALEQWGERVPYGAHSPKAYAGNV